MKVLLKQDVDTLGYAGEVHDVAPGYGRNYLIPQGLAVKTTPGVLKSAEGWRKQAEARREQLRSEYQALVERINDVNLNFTAKAGEQGKLYGSITMANVAEALESELGIELDRRKIEGQPLRQVGSHAVQVVLSREFRAQINVNIHPEGETPEEAAARRAAAAEAEAVAAEEWAAAEAEDEYFEMEGEEAPDAEEAGDAEDMEAELI